jgi:hypothetical protein
MAGHGNSKVLATPHTSEKVKFLPSKVLEANVLSVFKPIEGKEGQGTDPKLDGRGFEGTRRKTPNLSG